VKLVKKLLGDNEVEAVLQRLDRLTQDEARTTAAQTLEVVYGLVQNMNGEQMHDLSSPAAERHSHKTARHRLTLSGLPSVCFTGSNKLVPCLIEG
jgi:hypothetical protein